MGVYQNVPQDKYDSLRPEDKKKVDEYRNSLKEPQKPSYTDVIGRKENSSVEKPAKTFVKKSDK